MVNVMVRVWVMKSESEVEKTNYGTLAKETNLKRKLEKQEPPKNSRSAKVLGMTSSKDSLVLWFVLLWL